METRNAVAGRAQSRAYGVLARAYRRSVARTVGTVRPWLYETWPAAMNGQRFRQNLFRTLIREFDPQVVFESGTYCGASTQFLSHVSGRPVYTVEKNARFARCAARRFRNIPDVRVFNDDSRSILYMLRDSDHFPRERVLFYLDAHWEADLPLREEVDIITKTWTNSLVVIDDFKVPDDAGYGFDSYGDVQLSMDYLGEEVVRSYETFWPNCPSREENGARRGCVVLAAPEAAPLVAAMAEFRRIPGLVGA